MGRNTITSSERRGIIAIAFLALLIVGGGMVLSRCGGHESMMTQEEIEILLKSDSVPRNDDSVKRGKGRNGRAGKGKNRKDTLNDKGKKSGKTYRRRNFLEEPV